MLVASVTLALGVRLAVQVTPPSLARLDNLPLATVTSSTPKPVTASLKVKVTVAVSPILRGVVNGNAGCWPHRVDGVVGRIRGAAADIARQVHAGVIQGEDIGGVGDAGIGR